MIDSDAMNAQLAVPSMVCDCGGGGEGGGGGGGGFSQSFGFSPQQSCTAGITGLFGGIGGRVGGPVGVGIGAAIGSAIAGVVCDPNNYPNGDGGGFTHDSGMSGFTDR